MPDNSSLVLYVDESGTKEYAESPEGYGAGRSRYFVFGGVLLPVDEVEELSSSISRAKTDAFGTDEVEIKSNWLRMPLEREARYLTQFGINEEQLTEFVNRYYEAISEADLQVIATVVDKVHVQEDYRNPWYAPAIAYELLLQRVEQEADGRRVAVTIDDMSGKTPKGNEYKENLKKHHAKLRRHGSSLRRGFSFPSLLPRLKFRDSALSHLIQVADIAAYNVYRQFVENGDGWEDVDAERLATYDYLGRMAHKFRQGFNGRVQGYGIVKFPLRRRVAWGIGSQENKKDELPAS